MSKNGRQLTDFGKNSPEFTNKTKKRRAKDKLAKQARKKNRSLIMPKSSITQETKLNTRNTSTQVDAVFTLTVDGRELPTLATLGKAVEEAVTQVQKAITESYQTIPARV